jgi:hypothetical protein
MQVCDVSSLHGLAGGRRRTTAVQAACRRGPDCTYMGHRGRGGAYTPNIWSMLVTLEVSKLSGWLNADANCRAERRAYVLGI